MRNKFTNTNALAGIIVLLSFFTIFLLINYQLKEKVEKRSILFYQGELDKQAQKISTSFNLIDVLGRNFFLSMKGQITAGKIDSLLISMVQSDSSILSAWYEVKDKGSSHKSSTHWRRKGIKNEVYEVNFLPSFLDSLTTSGHQKVYESLDSYPVNTIFWYDDDRSKIVCRWTTEDDTNLDRSLGVEISLQYMKDQVMYAAGGVGRYLYLVEEDGFVLLHPGVADSFLSILKDGWEDDGFPAADFVRFFDESKKKEFFRFHRQVKLIPSGKVWILGMQLPSSEVLQDYYEIRNYVLLVGFLAFFVTAFFIIFSIYRWKRDQEDKKQAEILLESSYAQLLSYMEGTEFVNIYSLDRNYCYLNFNTFHRQEVDRNFRKKPRKGGSIIDVLPQSVWKIQKNHYDRALEGEHFMTTVQDEKEGKYYQQIFNPIYDTSKGVVGLTCSLVNITDKVVAQRELENYREHLEDLVEERTKEITRQKDFFQMLIDQVPNQIFVRDNEGRYVLVNKASAINFNMSIDQLVGRTLLETHHNPEEAELYQLEDKTILENDIVVSYEDKLRNRIGEEQWVIVNKTRIKLQDQYFVMGVLVDISHLKDTEGRLQKANVELSETISKLQNMQYKLIESEKMASLGQLMGGIAHEINNPINFVAGNISPLMQDFEDLRNLMGELKDTQNQGKSLGDLLSKYDVGFILSEMESLLSGINEGAKRIGDIVNNLRNFARPSLGEFVKSNLIEGLNSTINLVVFNVRNKIKISTDYRPIPEVVCMPAKLNQVFLNLLNNAIQAIDDQGEITIGTRYLEEEKSVLISFADTGTGIPEGFRNKVFDPFFTTKDVGKGTGLGLSLSFSIVKQHGGEINFDENMPQGTIFHIKLPVDQELD